MSRPIQFANPEELILAADMVQQVGKHLGRFHPAYPYLEFYIEVHRDDLPEDLRRAVPDDWIWWLYYPFCILARLAATGDLLPTCWIKRSSLDLLDISTSDVFRMLPLEMDQRLAEVRSGWEQAWPALCSNNAIRAKKPAELGQDWLGTLEWRQPEEYEREFFGDGPIPEHTWLPLYRYSDIHRMVSTLSKDADATSAFGETPARRFPTLASKLRSKYGVRMPVVRDNTASRASLLKAARLGILTYLMENGATRWHDAKKRLNRWPNLASQIVQKENDYRDVGLNEANYVGPLSRDLKAPPEVIAITKGVLQTLGTDNAEYIDEVLFRCHEKTIQRNWRSLTM